VNPVDRQTVARKLEYLRKQLETLEPYRSLPQEALRDEVEKRLAVERLLELCIQSIIDISRLLVSLENWRDMGDERDALLVLAAYKVIPSALADRLLQAKGFRNVLVHEYVEIELTLLHGHLRDDGEDLWAFARCLADYLQRTERKQ
jgi:uncharacterized protein YutE (UPF0331/DUF86 family)